MVTQLMLVNITAFILLLFIRVIYLLEDRGLPAFNNEILSYTMLPADFNTLLHRPWTLLTAMFAHIRFWDIFSHMVWLWCFGSILQNISGRQLVVPLYVFGSFCGMVFYIAGMHLVPAFRSLIPAHAVMGAGAGVTAIAAGITTLAPRSRVFPLLLKGGLPVWVISLIYLALHIADIVTSGNNYPSALYMLGGAFLGYILVAQYKRGNNWSAPINRVFFTATHVFHPKAEREREKEEIMETHVSGFGQLPEPFTKVGKVPEHKLNEILDKINEVGISGLTDEERETLLRASRENER